MGHQVRLVADQSTFVPSADNLLADAAALAGVSAWHCRLPDERLTWSGGVFDLFGLPPATRVDRSDVLTLYSEESRANLERVRGHAIADRSRFTLEAEIVRPDGERRWMRVTGAPRLCNGRTVALYGAKQDITAERAERERLRRLAERDPVTGLESRALFQTRFLDGPAAHGTTLLLIDLDGFKPVNDAHGHAAGDACLEATGRRLRICFPDASLIARIGGDEFAVLVPGLEPSSARARATFLLRTLAEPLAWQGKLIRIGASVGIAHGATAPRELFARADRALYAAKADGRGCVRIDAAE